MNYIHVENVFFKSNTTLKIYTGVQISFCCLTKGHRSLMVEIVRFKTSYRKAGHLAKQSPKKLEIFY